MRSRVLGLFAVLCLAGCSTTDSGTHLEVTGTMASLVGRQASVAVVDWGQAVWTTTPAKAAAKWGPGSLKVADPGDATARSWLFQQTSAGPAPCEPHASGLRAAIDRHGTPCNIVRILWVDAAGMIYNWRAD